MTAAILASVPSSAFLFLNSAAMGRDYQKNEKKKADKEKQTAKKAGGNPIPKFAWMAKASLAAYPDEDGNALYIGDKESVKDLLDPASVLSSRTPKNTEMLKRPGMGLCLAAASMHHGSKDVVDGSGSKALEKLSPVLQGRDAKEFLHAVKLLNLGKSGTASRSDVKAAVRAYVAFLSKPDAGLHSAVVKLAATASRQYLFGIHLIEQLAFFGKLGSWAKKLQRSGEAPRQCKEWLKDPTNERKLEEALVDLVMEKAKAQKRKKGSDSESSGLACHKSDSSASRGRSRSSSRGIKKSKDKKKERKNKKEKGRRGKSSASASTAQRNRSSSATSTKKPKKDKRPKDRKRARSARRSKQNSNSSVSPAPKPPKASKKADPIRFSSDGESEEAETGPKWEAWPRKAAEQLEADAKGGLRNHADGNTPALAVPVSFLENLPQDILLHDGLNHTLASLKKMKKNPKAAKVEALLMQLQGLAAKRLGHADTAAGKVFDLEPEPEAKTASFTAWSLCDAQTALANAENAKDSIGLPTGRTKKDEITQLAQAVPLQVMLHYPAIETALQEVQLTQGDWIDNVKAKPLVAMLLDQVREAVTFLEAQCGRSTGSEVKTPICTN